MIFDLTHRTDYTYPTPVADGVTELRIFPKDGEGQNVLSRSCKITPDCPVHAYDDAFGNRVEYFAIPFAHRSLRIENQARVETSPPQIDDQHLNLSLAEARQIYLKNQHLVYFFSHPSRLVPRLSSEETRFFQRFSGNCSLREVGQRLLHFFGTEFSYLPGATAINTPVGEVLRSRRGVCQDFAHAAIAILRHFGIPARYVSGYIEAAEPGEAHPSLLGAVASHAWVEILLPGNIWWGLDPTNHQEAGERHIRVAVGRDFHDVSPVRGSFRGGSGHQLKVDVSLIRVGK